MPPHSSDTGTSIGRGLTALCVVVVFLLVASLFGRFGMYFVTTGAAIYALARHGAEWRRIRDEQIARRRHGAPAGAPATRRLVLRPSLFTALGYIVGFGGLTAGILLAFMGVPWGTYLAFASAGVLVLWTMQMEEAGWRTSGRRRTRARRLRFVPWVRGGPRRDRPWLPRRTGSALGPARATSSPTAARSSCGSSWASSCWAAPPGP